jgi:NAD-dependent deacetylase sirtuin 5
MSEADNNDVIARLAGLLRASPRIVCIVGAGLSAPSGLATWRGTNGLWNDNDLKSLASPKRFADDPVTVWNFYGERLIQSLAAQPNAAHHALAALASWHDGWLTVNQNVDGTKEFVTVNTSDALNHDRAS